MVKKMNHCHESLDLDKVLKLTETISGFSENEKKNISCLLRNMAKIFKCDKIAFIQKQSEINTFSIISPSDVFQKDLSNDKIYDHILSLLSNKKEPILLDKTSELNSLYEISNFVIISPVILHHECIGCIFVCYDADSIGSKYYREIDLSYYELASNIIAIQENSYRIKYILRLTNQYRELLNQLSANLIMKKNSEMDLFIDECIQQTCELWDIDRGYLFLVDFENKELNKTNEWCAKGVKSLLEQERTIPFELFPWSHIIHKFNNDPISPIHIPDVLNQTKDIIQTIEIEKALLPEIDKSIDYLISAKNLKSVLLIPIPDEFNNNIFTLAILGFSQVKSHKKFPNQLIELLNILSCYIAEAIKRRRDFQHLNEFNQSTLEKILKWEKEVIEEDKICKNLGIKMQTIFDDHTATINARMI